MRGDSKDKAITISIYAICAFLLGMAAYIVGTLVGWW